MHEQKTENQTEGALKTSQWALIGLGILFALSALQTLQLANTLNTLGSQGPAATLTGAATIASTAQTGALDMTGWTANEKMNYEMHGIIPARLQQSSTNPNTTTTNDITQGLPTQVGGC